LTAPFGFTGSVVRLTRVVRREGDLVPTVKKLARVIGVDDMQAAKSIERTKIIFEVTDLDELVRHIETLGAKVVHVSDNVAARVKVVHVLDPFQNVFQLAERRSTQ
jgi:predicted enzyme related to lactoylglutathione lyase